MWFAHYSNNGNLENYELISFSPVRLQVSALSCPYDRVFDVYVIFVPLTVF